MLCALGVLWAHSYLVYYGVHIDQYLFDVRLDHVFVCVFFAISGFLICRSMARSQDLKRFLSARCVRLLPALVVLLLITVLIVGPLLTDARLIDYVTAGETWRYLLNINVLNIHTQFTLSGVFSRAPYPDNVNASLWTLPIEAWLYVMTAVGFCLVTWRQEARVEHRPSRSTVAWLCLGGGLLIGLSVFNHTRLQARSDDAAVMLQFVMIFAVGAGCYLVRDALTLRWPWLFLLGCGLPWVHDTALFSVYFAVFIVYLVLWLAYLPMGVAWRYHRVGDYSYGLYIYGFVVQQITRYVWPDLAYSTFVGLSTALSLMCAILSWHGIEQPAQAKYKRHWSKNDSH